MMRLFTLALLSQLLPTTIAATLDLHAKELDNPFSDDPSVVVISTVNVTEIPLHASSTSRRLQQSSSGTKCPSSEQALWSLALLTDSNPSETKWLLKQASTNTLMLVGPPSDQEYEANMLYEGEVCIRKGYKYVFRILDSGGDGICCDSGDGGFTMSVDGEVFIDRMERNDDWWSRSFLFHVGNLAETAAPKPAPRPTPSPSEMGKDTEAPSYAAIRTSSPTVAAVETYKPTSEPEEGVAISFIMMGDSELWIIMFDIGLVMQRIVAFCFRIELNFVGCFLSCFRQSKKAFYHVMIEVLQSLVLMRLNCWKA